MLNLALLEGIRLHRRPRAQRWLADGFLRFDYRKVDLVVEGLARIPAHPVIYAMNHTDNFSYWPFQYTLHRRFQRYTATWVKGKNFEQPAVSTFMRMTNNIPLASRGYLISRDFASTLGRRPEEQEYRRLRDALDAPERPAGGFPAALLETPRDILGRRFEPSRETYFEALDALYARMSERFVELNERAMGLGLDVLVYPQGSRSVRLSSGHIGIAEIALHLGATIVPVGCSNGDLIYPSRSPFARPGRIVYRVGEPISPSEQRRFAPPGPFIPLSRDAEREHRPRFQALVDLIMQRIDGLVDERHRYGGDLQSDGSQGMERFL
ncbi:MAG: 1-acyl-sn-glycerol-3-phosphate acyltransferase [Myxococcales bacterium]|nr:1-acyl-sn-glycerol-3-phosphate acyltransferase [Myxococcales bacterium]